MEPEYGTPEWRYNQQAKKKAEKERAKKQWREYLERIKQRGKNRKRF